MHYSCGGISPRAPFSIIPFVYKESDCLDLHADEFKMKNQALDTFHAKLQKLTRKTERAGRGNGNVNFSGE